MYEVLGKTKDLRTNTDVFYVHMNISSYLDLIGDNFDDFEIQRRREKHKIYERMKSDIKQGALLPTITLAVKDISSVDKSSEIKDLLEKRGAFNILDGLQRTHILYDLKNEGHIFDEKQMLLIEIWMEANIGNLVYRLIILNAGQKPMSTRHQVELLFLAMKEELQNDVPGLELLKESDSSRRTSFGKLPFNRIVSAYQAFVSKTPNIEKKNIIASELANNNMFAESDELSDEYTDFVEYLKWHVRLDEKICQKYDRPHGDIPSGASWFGSENVMNSFFSAIADFGRTEERMSRIEKALTSLEQSLSSDDDDPLSLAILRDIQNGFDKRRVNVGKQTRTHLFHSFKEYFREEGIKNLRDCWIGEST